MLTKVGSWMDDRSSCRCRRAKHVIPVVQGQLAHFSTDIDMYRCPDCSRQLSTTRSVKMQAFVSETNERSATESHATCTISDSEVWGGDKNRSHMHTISPEVAAGSFRETQHKESRRSWKSRGGGKQKEFYFYPESFGTICRHPDQHRCGFEAHERRVGACISFTQHYDATLY